MAIDFFRTFNFRNLVNTEGFYFKGREIFLVGKNGQGKTNFLEAIYYLCSGISFRTRLKKDIIRDGEKEAALFGSFIERIGKDESLYINGSINEKYRREKDIGFKENVKIVISNRGAGFIEKGGKKIKSRLELFFNFPIVIFSHEDISLVKGAVDIRRSFFDRTISLFDKEYFESLRLYYKVLKNKNALLKIGATSRSLLDVYDEKLISYGLVIMKKRRELIKSFNDVFSQILSGIAGELSGLRIMYIPSWKTMLEKESIRKILIKYRDREIALGFSLSGPHKDKFYFDIGGKDFIGIASTGQLRLCSLALKSGQAKFVFEKRGKRPIILLDDVLLEIDGKRRIDFLNTLSGYEQSFFTFLPEEDFLSYKKDSTEIFYVKDGVLAEWKGQARY